MGFFEGLESNIRDASHSALITTVVGDPNQTIGDILTALEGEADARYLLEAFRELTIGQIVQAAMENIEAAMRAAGEMPAADEAPATATAKTTAAAPKTNGIKEKKKSPPKAKKAASKSADAVSITTPDARKSYEDAIIKALKSGKHVDKKTGISSSDLRQVVGGEAPQAREILNELIDAKRVSYYGKARGTRYYIY